MKYLLIAILLLALVGCATAPEVMDESVTETEETLQDVEEEEIPVQENQPDLIPDIIIAGRRLDPDSISVPLGEETTLIIHNTESDTMRFEIALFRSEVSEDIPAESYRVVTINPQYEGNVGMKLNGAQVGTLSVE